MLYLIHHPEHARAVDLRGEASADVIAVRFDCTLAEMIDLAAQIGVERMKRFGLETGDLYITEGGKRVAHIARRK